MSEFNKNYIVGKHNSVLQEQLLQLLRITSDGDLISKAERTTLVKLGYVTKTEGFNIITPDGIKYLVDKNLIHS